MAKLEPRESTIRRSSIDEIIDLYKKDVDRTLLRENLRLTPDERLRKMISVLAFVEEVKRAAGRPKDFESIAEFEALREERERS
ncbi:MAG: hypothetical protein ACRD16_01555 [Thermoanaerobaculia bacterium]